VARGFGHRWIGWIKACLLSGASFILVNGKSSNYIQHRKGLRQGNPLPLPLHSCRWHSHKNSFTSRQ